MLIPIGHDQAISRWPPVTLGIVAVCTLVQVLAVTMSSQDAVIVRWGYQTTAGLGPTILTSLFVHGGWIHLVGNMLFLFLAGTAVEDRIGPWRFAALYLVGGVVATLVFRATNDEPALVVGASGAVSAIMGAFLVWFARRRIRIWYWFGIATGTFQVPAYVALPVWLLQQVFLRGDGDAVAYDAHLGGFLLGLAVAGMAPMARRFLDAAPPRLDVAPTRASAPPRAVVVRAQPPPPPAVAPPPAPTRLEPPPPDGGPTFLR